MCSKCERLIPEGEVRANYPTGTLCIICGEPVNELLEQAESLLKQYNKITGAGGRIKFF